MASIVQSGRQALDRAIRPVFAVAERFFADHGLLHASALTYTSLLSIVPLLAIVFSILKGLGAQSQLEPLLLSRLALDPETAASVLSYIENTNVGTLGALGAAALLVTVISVLGSIERSFNHIWRVPFDRPWWRKATDYLSAVLVAPFLLLAAVGITSSLQQQALLRWLLDNQIVGPLAVRLLHLAPYAINAVLLAVLYTIMPNRRPNPRGIAIGAILAGCAWQLLQASYVALQIGVSRYNAIYGALAQLPVTLVWIYLSWVLVLIGAEIAAVVEFGPGADPSRERHGSRFGSALEVLLAAAEGFRDGTGGVDPVRLARAARSDLGEMMAVVETLRSAGFVTLESGTALYVLARDPAAIDLGMVAALFERVSAPPGGDRRVAQFLAAAEARRHADLCRHTLADLLDEPSEPVSLPH